MSSATFDGSTGITHDLQLQVVSEFGLPSSYVRVLRAVASLYSREEIPFDELPHHIRYNRSAEGKLSVGMAVPDMSLAFVRGPDLTLETELLSQYCDGFDTMHRPLVIAAGRLYKALHARNIYLTAVFLRINCLVDSLYSNLLRYYSIILTMLFLLVVVVVVCLALCCVLSV